MQNTPTLYIVATPIGNLSDLSPRAIQTLQEADFILCEDTRHTKKLLTNFNIQASLVSLHEHNEALQTQTIIERLLNSKNQCAALVSDAGTPAVSDPGAIIINAAHLANIKIISIPGPCSFISAVAASGFLEPRIIFSAFLDRKNKGQQLEFARWKLVAPCLAVFFESPHRITDTLNNLEDFFGPQLEVCLSREISKLHEEHLRNKVGEVKKQLQNKPEILGEFACVAHITPNMHTEPAQILTIVEAVDAVLNAANLGVRIKDAVKTIAQDNNLDSKTLYKLVQQKLLT